MDKQLTFQQEDKANCYRCSETHAVIFSSTIKRNCKKKTNSCKKINDYEVFYSKIKKNTERCISRIVIALRTYCLSTAKCIVWLADMKSPSVFPLEYACCFFLENADNMLLKKWKMFHLLTLSLSGALLLNMHIAYTW